MAETRVSDLYADEVDCAGPRLSLQRMKIVSKVLYYYNTTAPICICASLELAFLRTACQQDSQGQCKWLVCIAPTNFFRFTTKLAILDIFFRRAILSTAKPLPHSARPTRLRHTRSARIFGVAVNVATQPQLKCPENAVVDEIVYSPAHQGVMFQRISITRLRRGLPRLARFIDT